ncbi:BAG family molecular chaperone regulator-like protein, putative [Medicago truncatula]|uniref:BAG family molecular chaperone regulator-like protein, putative n=1 Tax=Medicago truncatula TaxID=3880 RepID=G7IL14_MEDTR|nr:BAG family molecular chaperone regulator-like protein, putative [Medicago truncatula]
MLKAFQAVAVVGSEVDKLCDRVLALDVAVNGGTTVSDKEFIVTTELLMRKLLEQIYTWSIISLNDQA